MRAADAKERTVDAMAKRAIAGLIVLLGLAVLTACSSSTSSGSTDSAGAPRPVATPARPQPPLNATTNDAPTSGAADTDGQPAGMEYQVGDTGPGGGIVYYVSVKPFPCGPDLTAQCNYLEAAPGSSEVRRGWADVPRLELEVEGADATEIGTGWINTIDIIEQGNIDPVTSAAAYADAYEHNGVTDWYLPSRDEFKMLYEQRETVGEFSGADYWSSSEVSANMAWSHYFHQGHPLLPHPKNHYTHLIRPIRAF